MRRLSLLLLLVMGACTVDPDEGVAGELTGTLYVEAYGNSLQKIDLGARTTTDLGTDARMPMKTKQGGILCLEDQNLVDAPESLMGARHIDDGNGDIHSVLSEGFAYPRQSPDGTKVVFATVAFGNIVVVDFQTGAQIAVIQDPARLGGYGRPSWTPDGRLVFTDGYNHGIFISDAAFSNNVTRIAPDQDDTRYAIVSHDGRSIAYLHDRHVWKMGIDGANPVQIDLADTTSDGDAKTPYWSPDDAMIYWPADAGDVAFHSAADGTGPTLSLYATIPGLQKKVTILLGSQGMDWVR